MKRFISFLIVGVLATLLSINEVFALPPSTQASNVTFTTLANGKLRVIATKGNGTHRAIAIEQGDTVTGLPSGTYTGDADYLNAPDIDGAGAGLARIVYFGTDRRVDISGLTPGTKYTVKVFEYNVDGYNVADATNNPRSYTTLPAAPALTAATAITSSGFTINWNDPAGTWEDFEITVGLTSNFSSFVSGWNPAEVDGALNTQAFTGNTNTTYFYRIRSTLGSARSAWNTAATSVTTYPVTATLAEASGAVCSGNSYYLTPTGPTPGDGTNEHKFKVYDSGNNLVNLGGFAYTVIPLTPLSVGTYTYTVATVSNKTGEETPERTTFILHVNAPGTTAVVGDIADICALNTYTLTLTGNQPTNGEGTWTYSGPEGAIIADDNLYNSQVELVNYGAYTFTWTITSEGCNTTSDEVTFNYYATPDLAVAGDDDYYCGLTGLLDGNDPVNGEGTWTYSGPGTITFVDDNLHNTEFTASTHGIYTFTWTIANGTCTPNSDEVVLTIDQEPTEAVAGEDDGICVPTGTTTITYTLAATPVTVGSGEWTAVGGATFDDETSPNAVVTVPTVGTYTLTWTTYSPYYDDESESSCQPSSSEVVLVFSPAIDQAEINETTVLESIECGDLDVQLIANDPAVGNGLWTVSGPQGATYELFFEDFSDAIFVTDTYGTYTLTWTISDPNGVCEDTYEAITFELAPVPDPAIIPNKTEVNFACGLTKTLVAQEVNVGTGTWTVNEETAPEGADFSFTTDINANTVTFVTDTYGAYNFTWTVVGCTPNNSDNITVTFYNEMAGWTAGADQTACLGVDLPMTGATNPSVYTDGIGDPVPNGEWIKVSGPFGVVDFTPDRFTYNATADFPAIGTYVLEWRGYNGPCVVSDTKTVVVVESEVVTFNDLEFSYCNNESNLTASLSATPTGGTFSGSGVSGDIFSPFGLNAGTYTLTYTYNQPAGCTLYDYASVVVTAPTVITWTNTYELCENEGINLTEASPSGGVYSGDGIMEIGGQYGIYPTGPGTYTITYSYENVDGCTSVAENTYVVYPLPVVSFDPETPTIVCENSGVIDFTEYVSPMGEATCAQSDILQLINDDEVYAFTVYDGSTLSNQNCGTFDPDFEGPGTYTITYYYRDVNTCINVATHVIEVQATPDVYFNIGNEEYCVNDDTNVDLMTYISNYDLCTGGTWTFGGPGVTSSTFNPSLTGVSSPGGLVTITYTYECGACSVDGYAEVYVEVPTAIEFGDPIFICNNANPTPLNSYATPTGGIFEAAAGVVMTPGEPDTYEFDPSLVQPGVHTITYTYFTDNCEVSSTFEIEVYALPVVEFVEAPTVVCENETNFSFETYVSPDPNCMPVGHEQEIPGGYGEFTYSGEFGTICGEFDPSQVGVGTYTVTYTYTNENNCTDFATHEFEVVAPPTVSFGTEGTPTYCTTESEGIDLTFFAYPEGGTFSGSGVQGDFFTPSSVGGAGTYTLTYTYTDQLTGCTNFDEMEFVLVAPTAITWTNTYEVCANGSVIELSGDALPVGGTYSGTYVSGGNFDPTGLSVGQYTITYTYDNDYCVTTATKIVYVRQNPDISWPDYPNNNTFCVQSTSVDIRNATPSGGSFTIIPNLGLEITGNPFDPSAVGVGTYTLTYTYINVFGCVDVETKVISIIDEPTSVAFSNPEGSFCNDDESGFDLTTLASPAGGTFAGAGVEGTTFSPFGLNAGTYTLTYSLTHACGDYFDTAEFIVVAPATIVWELSTATVCATETSFDIGGATPTGGTYNGGSISLEGTTFNPSTAGVGLHVFTYTYVDGPCESVATLEVEVVPAPVVTWTQTFADYYCANDNSGIALTGAPANGQYTVEPSTNALSAGTFTPSMAEAGTYTITYTVTIGSCSDYATKTIVVAPLPEVSAGVYENVCITASSFTLTAGTPEGGNYSGNGVLSNVFNPASAGVGIHTLTYTYQDPVTLCYNSATTTIQVDEQPVISWTATYGPYCESDESMYQFNAQASIGTGEYSGPGVDGGYFSPSLVGAGTYTVTYTVTNGTCMAYETKTIVVDEQPVIFWTATYGPYCESDESSYELTASHTVGFGEYLGAGVSGGYFYPSEAGAGTHVITYTVTNGTCSVYATKTIVVNPLPTVSAGTYAAVCQNTATFTLTAGTPSGGTYSGNGVVSNTFNPASAGVGVHTLTYVYTDEATGCTNSATTTITVNALITANAGADDDAEPNELTFTLNANVPTPGTGLWTVVSSPANSNVNFTDATLYNTFVEVDKSGDYTFRWTITNGACSSFDDVVISFDAGAVPTKLAFNFIPTQVSGQTFSLNVRVLDQNDNMIITPNAVTFTVTVYEGDATFSSTVTGVIAANTSNKSVSVTLNADNPNVGAADIQLLATDDANLLEDGFSNWFNLVATIPTTQATSLTIVRGSTSFDLSWLRGNGDGVIVLAQKSAFTVANNQPQQGISYNNESNYGVAGNLVTTGIYATYSGTGTSFTLGNLQNDGVRYAVKVMEYKSSGVLRSYNRTNAASNSNNRSSTTLKGGVNEELPFVGENILSSSFITPNPARDYISLTVDLTQEAELRIAVYTADGKEVLLPVNNLNYNSGRHNFNIPLKGLAAGVYSVVITTGNELIMDNVVVMP